MNLLFSYLRFIFFLQEVYVFVCLDTLLLHSWGWVTWAKVLSGRQIQHRPTNRTKAQPTGHWHKQRYYNPVWILPSEKHMYKRYMPDKYVYQKQITKKLFLLRKPIVGNRFQWQLRQFHKGSILQLPQNCSQAAVNLWKFAYHAIYMTKIWGLAFCSPQSC